MEIRLEVDESPLAQFYRTSHLRILNQYGCQLKLYVGDHFGIAIDKFEKDLPQLDSGKHVKIKLGKGVSEAYERRLTRILNDNGIECIF